jgi:tetratricopeptide (TPR) repeat protein
MKKILFCLASLLPVISNAEVFNEKKRCDEALINRSHQAVTSCAPWLARALSESNLEEKASASLDYASALELTGKTAEAEIHFKAAVNYAQQAKKSMAIAMTSAALGQYYYRANAFKQAIQFLELSISEHMKLFGTQRVETIQLFVMQADAMRKLGDYQSALEVVDSALASTLQNKKEHGALFAHAHNIRALALEKLGKPKGAFASYLLAAQLMEQFDIATSIVFWGNLKGALLEQSMNKEAEVVIERIKLLSSIGAQQKEGNKEQLSTTVSLAFDELSVKKANQ